MYDILMARLDEPFILSDIILTAKTLYASGDLTHTEYEDIVNTARSKSEIIYETPDTTVLDKLVELESRIHAIEQQLAGGDNPGGDTEEYEDFVVGKWYYAGDKVHFNDKNYICIAPEGVVCVWSPADYPAYWEEQGD